MLDFPGGERWAIEVKRGLSPTLEKGFHHARDDLQPDRSFICYGGQDRYPLSRSVEAISLRELASLLAV